MNRAGSLLLINDTDSLQSVKDQTLDQQCTVTRPGIAAIASALLVELFVSLLQHPLGPAAPAPASRGEDQGSHPLGLVPHQIRGFLSTFENVCIVGRNYDCCSACSSRVVNEYKDKGWDFVRKALNEAGYVEELSGLKEVSPLLSARFRAAANTVEGPIKSRSYASRCRMGRVRRGRGGRNRLVLCPYPSDDVKEEQTL